MSEPQLHSSIVALASLAAGIAAKHPDMGLCQLDKLKESLINLDEFWQRQVSKFEALVLSIVVL